MFNNVLSATLFSGIGGPELTSEWVGWQTVFTCEIDDKAHAVLKLRFPEATHYRDIFHLDAKKYYKKIQVLTAGFPCQPFSVAGRRKGTDDERHLWPETIRIISEARPTWFIGENVAGILSMENSSPFEQWVFLGLESKNYFRKIYSRHLYRKRQTYVLNEIIESLIQENYTVQTFAIPAASVQAWHKRNRIFIIAHANDST